MGTLHVGGKLYEGAQLSEHSKILIRMSDIFP